MPLFSIFRNEKFTLWILSSFSVQGQNASRIFFSRLHFMKRKRWQMWARNFHIKKFPDFQISCIFLFIFVVWVRNYNPIIGWLAHPFFHLIKLLFYFGFIKITYKHKKISLNTKKTSLLFAAFFLKYFLPLCTNFHSNSWTVHWAKKLFADRDNWNYFSPFWIKFQKSLIIIQTKGWSNELRLLRG